MSISSIIEGLSVLEKISSDLLLIELSGNAKDNIPNIRKAQNAVKNGLTSFAFDIRDRIKNSVRPDEKLSKLDLTRISTNITCVKNLINHNDFEIIESFLKNYDSLILDVNFMERIQPVDDLNSLVVSIISERFS